MQLYRVTVEFSNDCQEQSFGGCTKSWVDAYLQMIISGPHFKSVTIIKD